MGRGAGGAERCTALQRFKEDIGALWLLRLGSGVGGIEWGPFGRGRYGSVWKNYIDDFWIRTGQWHEGRPPMLAVTGSR